MLAPTHLGPHCQVNQTPLVSQQFSFAVPWACILFDGNPKCKEVMDKAVSTSWAGRWKEETGLAYTLRSLHITCLYEDIDTCARNLSFHYRQWAARVLFSSLNICLGPVGLTKGLQQIHTTLRQHV